MKPKKKPVTTWFYPLFAHMAETHGLMIVESEADDIIAAVHASEKRRAESLAPTVAMAVRKMAGAVEKKPWPSTDTGCRCFGCVNRAAMAMNPSKRKARK